MMSCQTIALDELYRVEGIQQVKMKTNRKFGFIGTVLLLGLTNCSVKTQPYNKHSSADVSKIQDDQKTILQDLCWSPDGGSLYFSAMRVKSDFSDYAPELWTVYRFDTKTRNTVLVVKSALNVAISPSGKEIAVAMNINNLRNVYLLDTHGANPAELVLSDHNTSAPCWSPDGNQLAFTGTIDGTQEIYTVTRDGTLMKRITFSNAYSAFNPAWSPDGKYLAYYLEKGDGHDQIHVVKSDGSEDRNITNDTLNNIFPGWIDKKTIIYGQGHITSRTKSFRIDIDGTNKKQVLQLESMYARYAPDGSKIAYIDEVDGMIKVMTSTGKFLYNVTIPDSQNPNAGNPRLVGGPCEGCEEIFEYGDQTLIAVDTLPDFKDDGPKIKVTGTIYQSDGKTPAKDVILYVYHTDQGGIYTPKEGESGWAKRHGYIKGWVKTDSQGQYAFYTLIPGVYPDQSSPAHIHPTILEPNGKYYWLGSFHFEGDSLLTNKEMHPHLPRGGSSGLLSLRKEGNIWVGTRDIILGRNIPDYN
jgi:protocatechuate 3,4-dioxygenase beta subunit